ncbi:MAG: VOC family protein [Chloroflexi bacterium]|nr:VOC family protein [Chloroflexota bacterium]
MSQFKEVYVVFYAVRDFEGAKKFYGETLGWPVFLASDEMGWVEYGVHGSTHLAITRAQGDTGTNGGGTAVLSVDDAAATHAWLKSRGVKVDELMEIPGMVKLGSFYDPEGNQIQFSQSLF